MLQSKDTYICILSPLLAGNVGEDGMCHVTHVWVMWGSTVTCTCHMPMRRLYGPQSDWLCCSQNVLQSECVAVRMCCSQTVLQSECVAVRLCCSQTVLQSECVGVRMCSHESCHTHNAEDEVIAHDLMPKFSANDFMDRSQNVFLLEQAKDKALMIQEVCQKSPIFGQKSPIILTKEPYLFKMCSCSSEARKRHLWSRRYVKKVPFLVKRALSSWQKSHIFSKCVLARARQGKGTHDPGGVSKEPRPFPKELYLLAKEPNVK